MYRVFASLKEDINSGWVWLGSPKLQQRSIIRITNRNNGKSVCCEALRIDENFRQDYNQRARTYKIDTRENVIVINEWFRSKLGGFCPQTEQDFAIFPQDERWGRLRACLQHPQIAVRLPMEIAIVSVVLGIIGVGLGIISLCK